MGYETNYKLKLSDEVDADTFVELLGSLTDYDGWWDSYEIDDEINYVLDAKWYDNHKHMVLLSKEHPTIVFTLSGDGEESGDVWRKFYKDGKFMDAGPELIYKEFNENELQ